MIDHYGDEIKGIPGVSFLTVNIEGDPREVERLRALIRELVKKETSK